MNIKKITRHFTEITRKLINQSKSENLIEVDENNKILGPISKYEAHLKTTISKKRLHRAFSLFVFNQDNNLLLQKRSKHKATFPLLWTNSVCSHPLYNDLEKNEENNIGLKRAARRRLNFEMNIEYDDLNDFKVLDSYVYKALDNNEFGEYEYDFMLFLKMKLDFEILFNEEEVDDVKFVKFEDFGDLIKDCEKNKEIYTPWFLPSLKKVKTFLESNPSFLE